MTGKAKSVIQIWLWGGPCDIDTFDPKPEAGRDFTGALDQTLETNVSGIRIGQLLPQLAKNADKYSLIRSMTHGNNGHETAAYLVQTGRTSERDVFPGLGAVVSYFKGYDAGYKGLIPPYVVLTQPQGRFSEAGFSAHATSLSPPAVILRGSPSPSKASSHRTSRRNIKKSAASS